MQGCIKTATQSRYARMHKDSHTEPLHDATAQMAVIAQMQRHKWLSAQGRADPNDRNSTTPLHFRSLNKRGIIFLVLGEGEHATCGSCRDAYKQQLIQFFIQRVDKLQQYIAKSV